MLLGSAPASLLGVALSSYLKHTYGDGFEDVAQAILGAALVVCGIGFLVKAYVRSKGDDRPFLLTRHDRVIAVVIGLLGGFGRAHLRRLGDVLRARHARRLKLPERSLRMGLAVTLAVAGLKLLEVPGANVIIVGALVAAAVTGLAVIVRRLSRRPALARR
jgi:hypothetical protein